jgi:iron complex transport system substrate-binding protein
MREVNAITHEIVDTAYGIHTRLGPGLLESVYEAVLARMLEQRGLDVQRQAPIAFQFEGVQIEEGFRVDLLVSHCVVVELKSVERLAPVHRKQLLTYLRLMNLHVGLLINFGAPTLKEGLQRVVNSYTGPRPGS